MNTNKSLNTIDTPSVKGFSKRIKTLIFILEIALIIVLLVLWLSSETLQKSINLWVLFFYSFPSEFLIAIVPHEPAFLYFSKFYAPLTVALVSVAGTILAEILNYSVFKFVTDLNFFRKIRHKKSVNKVIDLFNKAPFTALCIAGLTPVPFYPFRFLVVLSRYPISKYILAVLVSRTPRFFIISWIGHTVKIPDYLFIVLFIALIVSLNFPIVKNLLKKKQKNTKTPS